VERTSSHRFKRLNSLIVAAIIVVVTYAFTEAALTTLYVRGVLEPRASVWLYENSGKTVHFDAIRGYRLTADPARVTRITKGVVEYVGTLKGNNEGFPDRDDFLPQREQASAKRYAVFGDSYTAAQFLGENWPDHVEDLTRTGPAPVRLLNFSVDGGGLANWWSVLTQLVERDRYAIDGVIFAVIPGNLWRGFSVSDHRGYRHPMFGRIPTWDPESFPDTLEEARRYLSPFTREAYIVSTDEFDRGVAGNGLPSSDRALRPYFATKLWRALKGRLRVPPPQAPRAFDSFDPWQFWMISDIARAVRAMDLPVMVVHVPSREELLRGEFEAPPPVDTQLFAALLDARLVDGKQAFSGRGADEIRDMWMPYDAHWAQAGSDHFGRFMLGILESWPE
jgi:hypothetical protein